MGDARMTIIEKEVPSLELCNSLKSLGFPQEGIWYWHPRYLHIDKGWRLCRVGGNGKQGKIPLRAIIAPTVTHILDELPWSIYTIDNPRTELVITKDMDAKGYDATYWNEELITSPGASAKKLVDALSKLWIHLAEQRLIKPKELKS